MHSYPGGRIAFVATVLTMKTLKNLSYPLLLFLVLSILLHLLAWSGFSGFGNALLHGLGWKSHDEVIEFQIAETAPTEPRTGEASSIVRRTATSTRAVSASTPSSKAVAQTAASTEAATVDEPSSTPVEERNEAAEKESVPDAPHTNSIPVITPLQTQAAGTVQNASTAADTVQKTVATSMVSVPDIFPFARERLTFSLYWSGIHVGTATLEAVRGNGESYITSVVNSNAVISAFYKVEDRAESRLVKGRPASFTLVQSEGSHHRNKETIFEPERNKVTYINHVDKTRQEYDMSGKLLWDVITGFYYVRRQPLEIGKSVYVSMFDSNKFMNAEVKVLRREKMELEDGQEISTIIVQPVLNSEGLFQKTGNILVWLTDDARRMPVRMETKLKIGRVTAKLKSFSVQD